MSATLILWCRFQVLEVQNLLASYPTGTRDLWVKRPGRESDHSAPSSAEVKEWVELYYHSPNTPSWRGAELKHRDNFTFTFPGVKWPARETDHSPSHSAQSKYTWSCSSTTPYVFLVWCYLSTGYVFMAWYLVKHRDNFTFTFTLVYCTFLCQSGSQPNY
jgi:hypothetical protein